MLQLAPVYPIIFIFIQMKMKVNSMRIRHSLLYEFYQGKSTAEAQRTICTTYGENFIDKNTRCRSFWKFKSGDCDFSDKPRSVRPQEVSETKLQELQEDQDSAQTQHQITEKLGVTQQAIFER